MWKRSSASISLSMRERRAVARSQELTRLQSVILPPTLLVRLQQKRARSFVLQRHYGINAGCAPRRQITCQQRDSQKEQRYAGKRERIGWADAIQETGQQARHAKGRHQTNSNPQARQQRALAQHHAK